MKSLTIKQKELLSNLEGKKNESILYNKGIELINRRGLWKTAFSLESQGLVEILENENGQIMVYLKGIV